LLDVQYHHHPLVVPEETNLLAGVVTCLSGYNGKEREYLNLLVTSLGGIAQEMFWQLILDQSIPSTVTTTRRSSSSTLTSGDSSTFTPVTAVKP
jgi:hypothetical protein